MAEEEKKKAKKIMIVPPPPTTGDGSVKIVMKGDSSKVIKVVTQEEITKKEVTNEVAIRDENVQEILTSVPHWMIRWGNILFLGLLLMIIGIAWMVKYPDVISIPFTIQSTNPDTKIVYNEKEEIKNFLVVEGQHITKNTPLFVFNNEANTKDILILQNSLKLAEITSQEIKINTTKLGALKLGSLQVPFAEFQAAYQAYTKNKNDKNKFRDAIVSYENLNQKLQNWNQKNVVKAPVNGIVKLGPNLGENKTGDVILEINSHKKQAYFGQIVSENSEFQKIKIGQEVQVSLSVYPEYENGVLLGKVASIHWDTALKKYVVLVNFHDELKTSYGILINPKTNLRGIANIITKRKRLLERFFSSF